MRAAVFLDRDGVVNRSPVRNGVPHPPAALQELEILPDVPEALTALREHGYLLVVVTNQPDVARGNAREQDVQDIHARLRSTLKLDAVFTCFHGDADNCDCRKPKPGLLLQAAREFDIDLAASFIVGDRWKDIEAGQRAACKTFFIDYGYREPQPSACDYRVGSLLEAARIILRTQSSKFVP